MKKYKFTDEARKELASITLKYREISTSLSKRFVKEFQYTLSMIRKFPGMGSKTYGDAQKFHLDVFKYTIIYILIDDVLHIVAVAPQRREPGYWKHRLKDLPQ